MLLITGLLWYSKKFQAFAIVQFVLGMIGFIANALTGIDGFRYSTGWTIWVIALAIVWLGSIYLILGMNYQYTLSELSPTTWSVSYIATFNSSNTVGDTTYVTSTTETVTNWAVLSLVDEAKGEFKLTPNTSSAV